MSQSVAWKIHIDGAARGNPGPAAYAFIIQKESSPAIEENGILGTMTNNVAEYTALVRALERAGKLGADRLIVHSDSELLVKQMNGQYRVKNPDLRILYDRAKELGGQFKQVVIRHVPRQANSRADRLCNDALDAAASDEEGLSEASQSSERNPAWSRPDRLEGLRPPPSKENHSPRAIRQKAIEHLRSAAARWAQGDAESPAPEAVWDQLWQLLLDTGVVPPGIEDE